MKTYAIAKVFHTIQGEGINAGTPATFIRLAGCNMWSGDDADRERDAARNEAECPKWCDTDFAPQSRMTAEELRAVVEKHAAPLVVFTGGEPMLQIDEYLMSTISGSAPRIQIETNGTVEPRFGYRPFVHVTMSPKVARSRIKLSSADELKLVWPAYEPEEWLTFPTRFRFLQPQADFDGRNADNEARLVEYVKAHPVWRLSTQTHKFLGIE